MKRTALLLTFILLAGALLAFPRPAEAQVFYATPTPDADGRVIYVVQPGDNCTTISLKTFVSIDELKILNNIQGPDCPVDVGQELLLGVQQAPQPTATPALPAGPTPTPELSTGQICVYVFNDVNGNGIPEEGTEGAIEGGAVSITDRVGKVSLTGTTAGAEALCFDAIPAGDYNISVAVPEGYNATTDLNYPLTLRGGDQSTLDFGAQVSSAGAPASPAEGGQSLVLGLAGLLLVLGGIGLGVYILVIRRKTY